MAVAFSGSVDPCSCAGCAGLWGGSFGRSVFAGMGCGVPTNARPAGGPSRLGAAAGSCRLSAKRRQPARGVEFVVVHARASARESHRHRLVRRNREDLSRQMGSRATRTGSRPGDDGRNLCVAQTSRFSKRGPSRLDDLTDRSCVKSPYPPSPGDELCTWLCLVRGAR